MDVTPLKNISLLSTSFEIWKERHFAINLSFLSEDDEKCKDEKRDGCTLSFNKGNMGWDS